MVKPICLLKPSKEKWSSDHHEIMGLRDVLQLASEPWEEDKHQRQQQSTKKLELDQNGQQK